MFGENQSNLTCICVVRHINSCLLSATLAIYDHIRENDDEHELVLSLSFANNWFFLACSFDPWSVLICFEIKVLLVSWW
jgi:hypothetical protein